MRVETETSPPEPDEDDGIDAARVSVHLIPADDGHLDAAVQLFGADAADPEKLAEALLRAALAVGQMAGPDVGWATARRFAAYDGSMP